LQAHSSRRLSPEGEACDLTASSAVRRQRHETTGTHVRASRSALNGDIRLDTDVEMRPLSREESIREAVILSFCDPLSDQCLLLLDLSSREWRRLLDWLDISGLALYFLDRMMELQLCGLVPPAVIDRLQQNLLDNTKRTRGMIAESVAIQKEFQESCLSYATLKGFSLSPLSVPKPELRHQFDLDFLVAEENVSLARHILERRGYRLYAISGRSWEFKINEMPGVPLRDLYKDLPGRSVELHVEVPVRGRPSMLERKEERDFYGISMPVLSPIDLFLGQGLHAYKDICSEFSRAAHLLEFRRHVLARCNDNAFWNELRVVAEENPAASLGLGVVTQLITHVMGDFAPEAFTSWTVHRLPSSALFWVDLYGRHTVCKKFPGDKLYLLLQKELEFAGVPAKRSLQKALLPLRLPPPAVMASANEPLSRRIRRYLLQLDVFLSRLRFHVVEGLRYTRESRLWLQRMNRMVR